MSRYGILSSARAVSTNVRLDIPVALGEVCVQVIKWPRFYVSSANSISADRGSVTWRVAQRTARRQIIIWR